MSKLGAQQCYICASPKASVVLDKGPVPIWTNSPDGQSSHLKFTCKLLRCLSCGHIYRPSDAQLAEALDKIYASNQAALSTSMSKGNWGKARGTAFLKVFTGMVDVTKHDAILEIGCDDGYLLKALKDRGAKRVEGIEPSLTNDVTVDGIKMFKGFARQGLSLNTKYDLIFASSVFEHIEDINGIMSFCREHLVPGGKLYFSVPHADAYITPADPALFTHQHVQYFNIDSARALLAKHGFQLIETACDRDSLEVLAEYTGRVEQISKLQLTQIDYQERLDVLLKKLDVLLKEPGVVVHAANNALNNILSWLGGPYEFILVDNDLTKHGKKFFGKTVYAIDSIDLSNISKVLIIPNAFRDQIRSDYLKAGFKGKLIDLTELGS
jgi:SAM-dependent methyltransferase